MQGLIWPETKSGKMKSRGIPNFGSRNRWERKESYQPPPTQEQVDAYIRSLERQFLQKDICVRPRPIDEHRGNENSRGVFAFSRFFWWLITVTLGCFAWLLQIIYEG